MRGVLGRYAVAWVYLAAVGTAEVVYALLPDRDQAAVLAWASTNVHNLSRDPVGCVVASAFFPTGAPLAWPALIALALFGANAVLGNWRTVVTCAAGHVIGTLVSEGILAYQIAHGSRPVADRFITDVGPSYIVVTAIAVALLWGRWPARLAAAIDFAVLIFVGDIFGGISHLHVAAVGHAVALLTGCTVGSALAWDRRRRLTRTPACRPAAPAPLAAAGTMSAMSLSDPKTDLHAYLREGREALLWKLDGLSEYDIRRPLTPTGTNLLGLVKHLAAMEIGYFGDTFGRPVPDQPPWTTSEVMFAEPNVELWATAAESRAYITGWYRQASGHADATIEELDLDSPGQVPWWPAGRNDVTLHRILVHMIAETHRHAGHADIVRELIDGAAGLRDTNSNLPEEDAAWWAGYRDRLEKAARDA